MEKYASVFADIFVIVVVVSIIVIVGRWALS